MTSAQAHISPHVYGAHFARIAQEFGPQPDDASCGASAVHHGLLLGGLTIPKATLIALFRSAGEGIDGPSLSVRLAELGFRPELRNRRSGQSTRDFLEQMTQEMERGFLLACIYGGTHWVLLGLWSHDRIRIVDSYHQSDFTWRTWELGNYNLTPEQFDDCDWENCVQLVRPGSWQQQYDAWWPARESLLRVSQWSTGGAIEKLQEAVHQYLNHHEYSYQHLTFCFSGDSEVQVKVGGPNEGPLQIETPGTQSGPEMIVVRRLHQSLQKPPELVIRSVNLGGWQLS